MADTKIDPRTPREQQTREAEARVQPWAPPQLLPDPKPQAGWRFRWVRASLLGEADPMNFSVRSREGWEPVKASDHPELKLLADRGSKIADSIEIGGLVLCKAPEEVMEARQKYYEQAAQQQSQSVDNTFLREQDPRMPLFSDKRSKVSFGKG